MNLQLDTQQNLSRINTKKDTSRLFIFKKLKSRDRGGKKKNNLDAKRVKQDTTYTWTMIWITIMGTRVGQTSLKCWKEKKNVTLEFYIQEKYYSRMKGK